MTDLKALMAADLADVFFTDFADTAIYTPSGGGAGTVCRVMVDHDVLIQADGYDTGVATLGTVICAMVADVGRPAKGATFTLGTGLVYTYTVQRVDRYSEDGLEVAVVVKS
jgi:hypothetical protein